eukprot:GHVS01071424.1.p1 GENE.GHVS01071424.1~~GHVS01071424.1.p1  ORF type:complete len:369 (-),score=50.74 GHVS01071424.1:1147-2253(-)
MVAQLPLSLFLPLLLLPSPTVEGICMSAPFNGQHPAELRISVRHIAQRSFVGDMNVVRWRTGEGRTKVALGNYKGHAKRQKGRTDVARREGQGVSPPTEAWRTTFKPPCLFLSRAPAVPSSFSKGGRSLRLSPVSSPAVDWVPSLPALCSPMQPLCCQRLEGHRRSVRLDRNGRASWNLRCFASHPRSSNDGGSGMRGGDSIETEEVDYAKENVIAITDAALERIQDLCKDPTRLSADGLLYLRMGVKSGGCSGLSYSLDVMQQEDILPELDRVERHHGFVCVVNYRSLMYLLGLQLDYSDSLIGGGFKFSNPNASRSCGCGMSFGVPRDFLQSTASDQRDLLGSKGVGEEIESKPKKCGGGAAKPPE